MPGARHGLKRYESSSAPLTRGIISLAYSVCDIHVTQVECNEYHGMWQTTALPSTAWVFMVQNCFGSTAFEVGFSQYDVRKPALSACGAAPTIGFVGMVPLFHGCFGSVRQYSHPMEHP